MPDWSSLIGGPGIGSLIGSLATQYLSAKQRHREWTKDNKKLEWRELIDALREAIRVMAWHYDDCMPFRVRSGEDERYRAEAMRKGEVIIRDRIFISKKVRDSGLFDQWVALSKECDEADVSFKERPKSYRSFEEKAHKFQNDLIRVSREDLGINE